MNATKWCKHNLNQVAGFVYNTEWAIKHHVDSFDHIVHFKLKFFLNGYGNSLTIHSLPWLVSLNSLWTLFLSINLTTSLRFTS